MKGLADYKTLFAAEIVRTMQSRDVTTYALASAIGVTQHQVVNWRTGVSLPYVATARLIAEALNAQRLVEIVREARTFRCLGCGRRRISEGTGSPRRYCDSACEKLARKRGTTGHLITAELTKIAQLTAAVDAMCTACEPEGLCQDALCPLRSVSPLPCRAPIPVAVPTTGRKSRWDNPAERERAAELMRKLHSENRLRRERISEWNRQRWASLSPAERAQRKANILAGIRRSRAKAAAWAG